jgi:hypothetical protein
LGLLTNHCSGKAGPEEEKVVKRTSDCGTWAWIPTKSLLKAGFPFEEMLKKGVS